MGLAARDPAAGRLGRRRGALSGARAAHDGGLRRSGICGFARVERRRPVCRSGANRGRSACEPRCHRRLAQRRRCRPSADPSCTGCRHHPAVMAVHAHDVCIALCARVLRRGRRPRRRIEFPRRPSRARLLGFHLFLLRDRHDVAGFRRIDHLPADPPHRRGARHHLVHLQHRAAGADGKHRGSAL